MCVVWVEQQLVYVGGWQSWVPSNHGVSLPEYHSLAGRSSVLIIEGYHHQHWGRIL